MQAQTSPDSLNRRLRNLRLAAGMSQSDVGKDVGLSRSAVTQIELGNRDLSADELRARLEALVFTRRESSSRKSSWRVNEL